MLENPYPEEVLDEDEDDGTMPSSLAALQEQVVGHRIIDIERNVPNPDDGNWYEFNTRTVLTLDNGKKVSLIGQGDCCAYTDVDDVTLNLDKIDHAILGVGTTDGYTTWHIYADLGDVAELKVGWSCGNPFYYGYGFDIKVEDA